MRILFVIGTVAVLLCSIYVSFNHTLQLFMEGGYKGKLQWGITIAAEVSFLMGVLSRFKARLKGTKPHGPANFMFWVGLIVVGWSNWNAGMAYGAQGVIKGLLVPVFVFGSEAVLAREYMEWWKEKNGISHNAEVINQPADDSASGIIIRIKNISNKIFRKKTISNQNIISNESISSQTISKETIRENGTGNLMNSGKTINEQTISNGNIKLMDSESRKEANNISVSEQSVSLTDNESISAQQTVSEKTISGNETINLMENETVSKENISEQTISNETVSKQNVSEKSISKESVNNQLTKPSNVVELSEHTKKRTKGRRKKVSPEEIERVKDIARRLLQENPRAGRYTLVEKAGCSHHVAQMVLEELKQSS